jgi:hypothetical protein
MGWAVGYDHNWKRDIGYGVPCKCDHPDCNKHIHRGLAYVCGGRPYGEDDGCGLFFCESHLYVGVEGKDHQVCERCAKGADPFEPKPDVKPWLRHKLKDASWKQWRDENPKEVAEIERALKVPADSPSPPAPGGK